MRAIMGRTTGTGSDGSGTKETCATGVLLKMELTVSVS